MLLTPGVIAGAPRVPRLINHPFRWEREKGMEEERERGVGALVSVTEKVEEMDSQPSGGRCSSS